jgi:hypothetical protein
MKEPSLSAMSIVSPQTNASVASVPSYLYLVDAYSAEGPRVNGQLWEISRAALSDTERLMNQVASLRNPVSPAMLSLTPDTSTIEERLFDATASVKVLISRVSMYMTKEWRDKLFRQIDSLHDLDEWDADDKPVERSSFESFLKTIIFIKPQRHPGLGLSYEGHLIAAWTAGKDRLTIEFLAKDRVRWVVTRDLGGEIERAAGQTVVSRLYDCLTAYNPTHWFSHE